MLGDQAHNYSNGPLRRPRTELAMHDMWTA